MKKNNFKKIIAILCAVTLLPWGTLANKNAMDAHASEATTAVTNPDMLEQWTITDVGLADGNYGRINNIAPTYAGTATGKSQDQTAFSAYITFPAFTDSGNRNSILYIGDYQKGYSLEYWTGDVLYFKYNPGDGTSKVIATLDKEIAKVTTWADTTFKCTLTTEFVEDEDGDFNTTNVNIGLYINGNLYNNQYLQLEHVYKNTFPQNVAILNNSIMVGTYLKLSAPDNTLDRLEKWTITDVGLADGDYGRINGIAPTYAGTATGKSQDQTAFSAYITFPAFTDSGNRNSILYIGDYQKGYSLEYWTGDVLYLKYNPGDGTSKVIVTLDKTIADVTTWADTKFQCTLTTEFVDDEDGDDTTTDVKVGLFINNTLYNGAYLQLESVQKSSFPQNIAILNNSIITGTVMKLATPITAPSELEGWTIADVGLDSGDYMKGDRSGNATGRYQDGTAFNTTVTFPILQDKRSCDLFLGEGRNADNTGYDFRGYAFEVVANTNFKFMLYKGSAYEDASTRVATLDNLDINLLGQELDIIVTSEFFNNNGTTTDVKVGLYINGTLQNNGEYYVVTGVPVSAFSQQVYLYTAGIGPNGGGEKIVLGAPRIAPNISDEGVVFQPLAEVGYELPASGAVMVNSVQKTSESKLTGVGDYRIVHTVGNYVTAKTVVLWKLGAVNADGDIDVRDVVALKKLNASDNDVLARAVRKGADVDESGSINKDDCEALRNNLVGND